MGKTSRWDFTKTINFDYTNTAGEECSGEAEVRFYGYDDPGRLSGLPENCYPPEGDSECEVLEISEIDEKHPDYAVAMEAAEAAAQKEINDGLGIPDNDGDGPDEDDYYDRGK